MVSRLFFLFPIVFLLFAFISAPVLSDITVHLVPHTHDDVGWQVTVDQYYIGSVQYIITTVIEQLLENPDRKFIYVEQAYFQRWWRQQNDQVQNQVKGLVKSGQLEFINGGWCMHDEAGTHFVDMIDQTTYGHGFIKDQFDVVPKIGWQIDPFGHSATQAALLSAEVGFEALFFARIDYQDDNNRRQEKTLEWIWRASASLGQAAQLFTGMLFWGYGPPNGFCWDIGCNDLPVQDDMNLEDYNLNQRVDDFINQAKYQAGYMNGDDIIWTLGSDFQYTAAHEWFINLDKIIAGVNNRSAGVKAMYSTPSLYVEAKHRAGLNWTLKTDDLFPYADCPDCFWTGYFTSRPALKRYVRVQSAFLQVARHLDLFTGGNGTGIEPLLEALSVAQHHDGVSGTARQAVTLDYARRLAVGGTAADKVVEAAIASLTTKSGQPLTFSYCPTANTSQCVVTQASNAQLVVVLYNSLARNRTELVRIPVDASRAAVYDSNGASVISQVIAIPPNAAIVQGAATFEVRFIANVPGLGLSTYFVNLTSSDNEIENEIEIEKIKQQSQTVKLSRKTHNSRRSDSPDQPPAIANDYWRVNFDGNGLVSSIDDLKNSGNYPLQQNFLYYNSFQKQGQGIQDSGAYIFRPSSSNESATPVAPSAKLTITSNSPVSVEANQQFGSWLSQTIRLTFGSPDIIFEYTVGPIPIADNQGKEIISRFTSNVMSGATWYTDSNGREWQQRVRDYRATWKYQVNEEVAGNYYPTNAGVWLADGNRGFGILNDRSQGSSSMQDGAIELMVHRRLLIDDQRGVGEPLNETGLDGKGLIITGQHNLILAPTQTLARSMRLAQVRMYNPFHQSYAPFTGTIPDYISSHNQQLTYLQTPLPLNIELLTATSRVDGTILIRLAHSFGVGEDSTYSQPVDVDLSTLFKQSLTDVTELSLTANQNIGDIQKLNWNITNDDKTHWIDRKGRLKGTVATIGPMEIHTYSVKLA